MADYEKMYYHLFNNITDMIEKLQQLQQETEKMYIDAVQHNEKH